MTVPCFIKSDLMNVNNLARTLALRRLGTTVEQYRCPWAKLVVLNISVKWQYVVKVIKDLVEQADVNGSGGSSDG